MFNVHINTLVVSELSLSSQSLALTDSLTRTTKVVGCLVGWLVGCCLMALSEQIG